FGDVPDTGTDRGAGVAATNGLAGDADFARGALVEAEDGVEQFRAASADEAADADDLAGTDGKRDVPHAPRRGHAADFEEHLAAGALSGVAARDRLDGGGLAGFLAGGLCGGAGVGREAAADHLLDEGGLIDGGDVGGGDVTAVAQDGDAVAGGEDLAHAVRHIDDGQAAGGEVADDLQEALDLGDGQRGGGFIEDDDACPPAP